jgi:hypothetical protein
MRRWLKVFSIEDLADAGGREALPPSFLVLAGVRIGRQDHRDLHGSRLHRGVDGDQQAHQVVVHAEDLRLVDAGKLDGAAVGDILHDVHVSVAHRGEDLRLELAVREPRVLRRHEVVGGAVLVDGLVEVDGGGHHVACEVHLADDLGSGQLVGTAQRTDALLELVLRDRFEVSVDLLGKCHPAGAGQDADLGLARVRHVS